MYCLQNIWLWTRDSFQKTSHITVVPIMWYKMHTICTCTWKLQCVKKNNNKMYMQKPCITTVNVFFQGFLNFRMHWSSCNYIHTIHSNTIQHVPSAVWPHHGYRIFTSKLMTKKMNTSVMTSEYLRKCINTMYNAINGFKIQSMQIPVSNKKNTSTCICAIRGATWIC